MSRIGAFAPIPRAMIRFVAGCVVSLALLTLPKAFAGA